MGQEDSFHLSAEYAGESQEVGLHVGWREIAIKLVTERLQVLSPGYDSLARTFTNLALPEWSGIALRTWNGRARDERYSCS